MIISSDACLIHLGGFIRLKEWQECGKRAAFTRFAFYGKASLHPGDQPACNGLPQSETGNITGIVQPFKSCEYPGCFFLRHPGTGVLYREMQFFIPVFRLQADFTLPGEFNGVGKQIVQDLLELGTVTAYYHIQTGKGGCQPQLFLFGQRNVVPGCFAEKGLQPENRKDGFVPAGIQQVESDQRIDQPDHVIGRMEYIFRILVLAALLFFPGEQFGASFDSSQWRTKVMSDGEHHAFSGL